MTAGIAARALLGSIRVYKFLVSPHFTGSCRFLPSCADYAREAISRYGALHGSWLAARRLARCHPFCAAGHDPVPLRSSEARVDSDPGSHVPSQPPGRTCR